MANKNILTEKTSSGKLYVIATPIGNLGDLSSRALEVISELDILAAEDTRVSKKIAQIAHSSAKLVSLHKFNENSVKNQIIKALIDGKSAGLVSDAGTPAISDPGFILVNEAHNNQIDVIALPGPSAVSAACSISGFDCQNYTFIGFLPKKSADILDFLSSFEGISHPVVFFESPRRILKTLTLLNDLLACECKVALCKEISKKHEKVLRGKVSELLLKLDNQDILKGEWTCIIEKLIFKKKEKGNSQIRSLDEVCDFFGIKKSYASKILALIYKKSRQEIYKNN